jgi:serine/threonine protein kinase/tetratricopeptide (TPR) repeat protein
MTEGRDPQLFDRVEALYFELEELGHEERTRRLEALRESAPDLHRELAVLFGDSESAARELDAIENGLDQMARQGEGFGGSESSWEGRWVGPYRILRLIGEGGMGRVFEAEQSEPFTRRVAVKVLRSGIESRTVLARFEAERQALAVMSHPNIARMLDAGSTDDGQPYFAMELVEGLPITHWAEEHQLDLEDRIELMLQVCDALQHAHLKGVVHRDLKPSNILVHRDGEGEPVATVIDFGIAKAVDQPMVARTFATRFGELVGTPEYMSPEQASLGAVDVDTRSDVYGLGLVLYELIVGELPIPAESLRGLAFDEICRRIRQDETPRPSVRVNDLTTSGSRPTVREPSRRMRSDLDTVVLKALAKDRDRRYESAAALGADLRRYLRDEPVDAAPPSVRYRASKFVRRHRLAVVLGSGAAATLLIGAVIATIGLVEARRAQAEAAASAARAKAARAAAEEALRTSEETTDYLVGLFQASDPRQNPGLELTAGDLLQRGVDRIDELEGEPAVQARLLETLGDVSWSLGAMDRAEPLLDRALELRRGSAPDPDRQASVLNRLGSLYRDRGEPERAEEAHREAVALLEAAGLDETAQMGHSLNSLGIALSRQARYAEAAVVMRRSLAVTELVEPEPSPNHAAGWLNLASTHYRAGDVTEALGGARRALELFEATLPENHPNFAVVHANLALMARQNGEFGSALVSAREALRIDRSVLPAEHPAIADDLGTVALIETLLGRSEAAAASDREALQILEAAFGPASHRVVAYRAGALASQALAFGNPSSAVTPLEEYVLPVLDQPSVPDPRSTVSSLRDWATALRRSGRPSEALQVIDDRGRQLAQMLQRDDLWPSFDLIAAMALLEMGEDARAVARFERAVERADCTFTAPCELDEAGKHVLRAHWYALVGDADRAFETLGLAVESPAWAAFMLDARELGTLPRDDRWAALERRLDEKLHHELAVSDHASPD